MKDLFVNFVNHSIQTLLGLCSHHQTLRPVMDDVLCYLTTYVTIVPGPWPGRPGPYRFHVSHCHNLCRTHTGNVVVALTSFASAMWDSTKGAVEFDEREIRRAHERERESPER